MIHLGDITKINGAEAPVVDVITGGSPCQDLSVAGKRAGLAGERSGLFVEQIRVIKEMRQRDRESGRADDALRPRYMVWENVPGAFSSNQGKDFAAVLEETIRIVEPQAPDVPVPPKGWPSAGCIYDELGGWSVAWRVHDAQFWGVPQRRKRIALVADFGGLSAPEILFERKGLSRDSEPRTEAGKGAAAGTESGADSAICLQGNGIDRADTAGCNGRGWRRGTSYTLNTIDRPAVMAIGIDQQGGKGGANYQIGISPPILSDSHGTPHAVMVAGFDGSKGAKARTLGYADEQAPSMTTSGGGHVLKAYSIDSLASNSMKSKNPNSGCREIEISKTLDCADPNPSKNQGGIAVVQGLSNRGYESGEIAETLRAGPHGAIPMVAEPIMVEMTSTKNTVVKDGVSPTLTARMGTGGNQVNAICMDVGFFQTYKEQCGTLLARQYKDPPIIGETYQEKTGALMASGYNKLGTKEAANDMFATVPSVRRLTPKECERLQNFPDDWTNIGEWVDSKGRTKQTSDSARYKALGNSIALPFWAYLMRRISAQYERPATMGSLFDGISGFPLCALRAGMKPVWSSEIEEFAIAVCKRHFGDEETGERGDVGEYL